MADSDASSPSHPLGRTVVLIGILFGGCRRESVLPITVARPHRIFTGFPFVPRCPTDCRLISAKGWSDGPPTGTDWDVRLLTLVSYHGGLGQSTWRIPHAYPVCLLHGCTGFTGWIRRLQWLLWDWILQVTGGWFLQMIGDWLVLTRFREVISPTAGGNALAFCPHFPCPRHGALLRARRPRRLLRLEWSGTVYCGTGSDLNADRIWPYVLGT